MADFAHRHYEAIAKVLHETKPTLPAESERHTYEDQLAQWQVIAVSLGKMFARDNEGFNIARFVKAANGK